MDLTFRQLSIPTAQFSTNPSIDPKGWKWKQMMSKWLANDTFRYPHPRNGGVTTSAEFVTIHCPGFVAVIGPTKPPWHGVHRFFFEVTVRLQKKGCGTQWGWEKNISLNPSQLHTPTWILQNESQKVSPSFGIYVLYKEYSIEEHTKFRITGQKHFTLGVINPIWYTALRTPGLFFLRMTILNAETQDNFLGNCWQMILHPRNSTVTCRSTWPRQPLRWGNGIMIKPSALTPNASPLRDTGIWIYKASSSANIFLRGGDVFVGSWMNVCDMISTHVQANQRSTKLTCWEWGQVRTTEIGSPQRKKKKEMVAIFSRNLIYFRWF